MGFWDRIKSWFGFTPSASVEPRTLLEKRLDRVVRERIAAGRSFSDREIADEVLDLPSPANVQIAVAIIDRQFREDVLRRLAYVRSHRPAFGGRWVFHPLGAPPPGLTAPRPPAAPSAPGAGAAGPRPPAPAAVNPYLAPEILGLSAEEMRKRALRINPFQTAWIGRVDTIPPQSDERTALIDRGLILRGLLTEEQITEIHRVGDLWLKHYDAVHLAEAAARQTATGRGGGGAQAQGRDQGAEEEARRPSARNTAPRRSPAAGPRTSCSSGAASRRASATAARGRGARRARAARALLAGRRGARAGDLGAAPALAGLPHRGAPRARTTSTSRCPSAPAARGCSQRPTSPSPRRRSGCCTTSSRSSRSRSRPTGSSRAAPP